MAEGSEKREERYEQAARTTELRQRVSVIALFIALGGTGYAAFKLPNFVRPELAG